MAPIQTTTLSNQNISAALLVATYTATADLRIMARVFIDQVAGNGDYTCYMRIQRFGAGSSYRVIPITTANAAAGVLAVAFVSIPVWVQNTDVVTIYVLGQAGDIATPDIITEIWDDTPYSLASIAAAVWSYVVRTLTWSIASLHTALSGTDIEIDRGDTFLLSLTNLGSMAGWTKVWFTVKHDKDDTDAQSIIQLVESNPGVATDGLLWIEGAVPALVTNGSITMVNAVTGDIDLRVEAVEMAKLVDCGNFYYDIQYQTATNTLTLVRGCATIVGDVTRTV
jgi:hypothetical protein